MAAQQQKNTRQALLDAACKLFAEHGFEAVSTRMIADEAGVNLGGIHYHFGSKHDLYVAAFRFATETEKLFSLGIVAEMHPELMDTREGQAEIIHITARQLFREFFNIESIGWTKRMVLQELCFPSTASPILDQELFKPNLLRDVKFLHHVCPDASEETLLVWAIFLVAQLIFYVLTQSSLPSIFGLSGSNKDFYTTAARETANALILMMGLPQETDQAE